MPAQNRDLENLALTLQGDPESGPQLPSEKPDQLDLDKMTIMEMIHARRWIDSYEPGGLIAPLDAHQAQEDAIRPDEPEPTTEEEAQVPSLWDSIANTLRSLADHAENTPLSPATKLALSLVRSAVEIIPTVDTTKDAEEDTTEVSNRVNTLPPMVLYYRVLIDKITREFSPHIAEELSELHGTETAPLTDQGTLKPGTLSLRDAAFVYQPAQHEVSTESTGSANRARKIDMSQLTEVTSEDMEAAGFLLDLLKKELNNGDIDSSLYAHFIIDLAEKNEFSDSQRHYLLKQSHVNAEHIAGSYYRGPAMDLHMTEHMTELVGRWLYEDIVERVEAKAHIEIEEALALANIRSILDHVPELVDEEKADFFNKLAGHFDGRLEELERLLGDYDVPRAKKYIDTDRVIPRPTSRRLRRNIGMLGREEVANLQKERDQIRNLNYRSEHFY